MQKIIIDDSTKPPSWLFFCPGCMDLHRVFSELNEESPSSHGQLLVEYVNEKSGQDVICIFEIKEGSIQYSPITSHKYSGMTIELPILGEGFSRE